MHTETFSVACVYRSPKVDYLRRSIFCPPGTFIVSPGQAETQQQDEAVSSQRFSRERGRSYTIIVQNDCTYKAQRVPERSGKTRRIL